jgi:hypothetical protein
LIINCKTCHLPFCSRVLIKVLSIQCWVLDTEHHAWLKLRIDRSLHTMWNIISQHTLDLH